MGNSVSACHSPTRRTRTDSSTCPFSPKFKWELSEPKTAHVIGAPLSEGQDWAVGVDFAPDALRKGGLREVVDEVGWLFQDCGDLQFEHKTPGMCVPEHPNQLDVYYSSNEVKNAYVIGSACKVIYEEAKKAASDNKFVLTIGGDHSIAAPTIAGIMQSRKDLAVVWVDAHGDCNTPETSPSANYHGMPVAHVLGWFRKQVFGFEWMEDHLSRPLPSDRLVFIGLRDVDPEEKRLLRESGIKVFTMMDVDRLGISQVMETAINHINPDNNRPMHLSFDIDAIDPAVAPGTGTKAKGGLTYRESHYICERLASTGMLGSMDVVEINPVLDKEHVIASRQSGSVGKAYSTDASDIDDEAMHGDNPLIKGTPTVRLGLELIESALGKTII